MTLTSQPTTTAPTTGDPKQDGSVPWYLWAVAFASTSVIVGVTWDISWHRSIGRDTFWTPAHLAIYLGGIVAGLSCGWLVLRTTFAGSATERDAGVSFWGFRGPLGAWVCIWGAIAMITSGPFDDWWHNAYGLDVEILSPPHIVLAAGIVTIQIGAMLMALAWQNNANSNARALPWLFVFTGGMLILNTVTVATEEIAFPNEHHRAGFFLVSAGIFPLVLVGISRSARSRWGATQAAAVYMGATMLAIWILQLFPAEPLLAPIMRPVEQMVPPAFPLILVAPAIVIDLILHWTSEGASQRMSQSSPPPHASVSATYLRPATIAAGAGVLAIAVLGMVQWPFADFLLSEHARNFFFGADQWDYNVPPGQFQYEFWGSPATAASLGWASAIAVVSSVVGMWWGNWMKRVRR